MSSSYPSSYTNNNNYNNYNNSWIRSNQRDGGSCTPVVGVLATDEVERISCKNGLLFHELLSGFLSPEAEIHFRLGSSNVTLKDYQVHFVKASELRSRPLILTETKLKEEFKECVTISSPESLPLSNNNNNNSSNNQSFPPPSIPPSSSSSSFSSSSTTTSARKGNGQQEQEKEVWYLSTDNSGSVIRVRNRKEIPSALVKYNSNQLFPWSPLITANIVSSLEYVEMELIGAPSVMILAVASTNTDPLSCFEDLSHPHHWPPGFQNGQFNMEEVTKFYVLLHDENEGKSLDSQTILAYMQKKYGSTNCRILPINGMPQTPPPDIWTEKVRPLIFESSIHARRYSNNSISTIQPGGCLSNDNLLILRDFVVMISGNQVLPAMERRVAILHNSIASAKKGMKNMIKSYFFRKPKETTTSSSPLDTNCSTGTSPSTQRINFSGLSGEELEREKASKTPVAYRFESIESQTRLMADTCLVMKDFDAALSHYKLISSDFKADKAWLHYGCVLEYIALTQFYAHVDRYDFRKYFREIETNLESAFSCYQRKVEEERLGRNLTQANKTPHIGARLATRVAFTYMDIFLHHKNNQNYTYAQAETCADYFLRASRFETPFFQAICHEQAAWCFLKAGHVRKFAFQMTEAGFQYVRASSEGGKLKGDKHAIRCFATSIGIYLNSRWSGILEQLYLILTNQLVQLKQPILALYFTLKLLSNNNPQQSKQKINHHSLVTLFLSLMNQFPHALSPLLKHMPYYDNIYNRFFHINLSSSSSSLESKESKERMGVPLSYSGNPKSDKNNNNLVEKDEDPFEQSDWFWPSPSSSSSFSSNENNNMSESNNISNDSKLEISNFPVPFINTDSLSPFNAKTNITNNNDKDEVKEQKNPNPKERKARGVQEELEESFVKIEDENENRMKNIFWDHMTRELFGEIDAYLSLYRSHQEEYQEKEKEKMKQKQKEEKQQKQKKRSQKHLHHHLTISPVSTFLPEEWELSLERLTPSLEVDSSDPLESKKNIRFDTIHSTSSRYYYNHNSNNNNNCKNISGGIGIGLGTTYDYNLLQWRCQFEKIFISFEIVNPLLVAIPMTSFHLVAKFCSNSKNRSKNNIIIGGKREEKNEQNEEIFINEDATCPYFESELISIILQPKERKTFTLSLTPYKLGMIEIIGVKWCVFEKIYSSSYFHLQGPLLQKTQEQRSSKTRGKNTLFMYRIVEEMPILSIQIDKEKIPTRVFDGEVIEGSLLLTNSGGSAATSVVIKTNFPTWFCVNEEDVSSYNQLYRYNKNDDDDDHNATTTTSSSISIGKLARLGVSGSIFKVEADPHTGVVLQPGEKKRVYFYLRPGIEGKHDLHILCRYEGPKNSFYSDFLEEKQKQQEEEGQVKVKVKEEEEAWKEWSRQMIGIGFPDNENELLRYCQASHPLAVFPSLSVDQWCYPNYANAEEAIIAISLTNRRRADQLVPLAVISASRTWKLEPLSLTGSSGSSGISGEEQNQQKQGDEKDKGAGDHQLNLFNGNFEDMYPSQVVLGPNEKATFHFRLVPVSSGKDSKSSSNNKNNNNIKNGRKKKNKKKADVPPLQLSECYLSLPATSTNNNNNNTMNHHLLPVNTAQHSCLCLLEYMKIEHNREILQMVRSERKKKEAINTNAEPLSLQAIRRQNQQLQEEEEGEEEEEEEREGEGYPGEQQQQQQQQQEPLHYPLLALCPPNKSIIRLAVSWGLQVGNIEKKKEAEESDIDNKNNSTKKNNNKSNNRKIRMRKGQHHLLTPLTHRHTAETKLVEPINIRLSYPPVLYAHYKKDSRKENNDYHENMSGRMNHNSNYNPGIQQEQEQLLENAILPVSATIFNCQTDVDLSLSFEALNEPVPGKKMKSRAALSPSFQWIGTTRHYIPKLKAGCTAEVKLFVRFLRPGIYDINRFRLVLQKGNKKVTKKVTYQFLVEVKVQQEQQQPQKKTVTQRIENSNLLSSIDISKAEQEPQKGGKEGRSRKLSDTMELLSEAEELLNL